MSWGCLAWRRGGTGEALALPTTPWKEVVGKVGFSCFSHSASKRTRRNGLCSRRIRIESEGIFSLKELLSFGMLNKLVESPSQKVLKKWLDGSFSATVQSTWWCSVRS